MPTYDYKCPSCHEIEEFTHKMNETIQPFCYKCYHQNKPADMKRVINVGLGVHFKGSGFYETDYKNK